jgi:tetratricopeptide (TPR) repeat protein
MLLLVAIPAGPAPAQQKVEGEQKQAAADADQAKAPVPIPAKITTQTQFLREYTRFAAQATFYAYKHAKPELTEDELLDVWNMICTFEDPSVSQSEKSKQLVALTFSKKLKHPLLEAMRLDDLPKDARTLEQHERMYPPAIKASEEAKVGISLQIRYTIALGAVREKLGKKELADKDFAHAFALFGTLLRSAGTTPITERMMLRRLLDRLEWIPLERGEALLAALGGEGILTAWTAEMLKGEWHLHAGWEARGGGFANTVTREGWAGFHAHLSEAAKHFKKAHELNPEAPEAATRMIQVAMAGHAEEGEGERFWFDKAVAACFDWEPAYDSYSWALQPRWGGSNEAMLAFGRECKATGRYDTDVPYELFKIAVAVDANRKKDGAVWEREYGQLRVMLLTYADKNPGWALYSHTRLLVLGWRTGRWEDAHAALVALGKDQPVEELVEAIAGSRVPLQTIVAEVRAQSGKNGERVVKARELLKEGEWQRAKDLLESALQASKEEPVEVQAAVKELAYPGLQQAEFNLGKPVELRLEEGLPGWIAGLPDRGRFKVIGPASLSANAASIKTGARFGRKYAIEADLSCTPDPKAYATGAVIVLDERAPVKASQFVCSFGIVSTKQGMETRCNGVQKKTAKLEAKEGPYKVKIQMWNEHWVVELDGREITRGQGTINTKRHAEGDQIGLNAWGDAKFENIRIQKLTERPAGLTEEADAPEDEPAEVPVPQPELEEPPAPFRPRF